jgi:hypothetical protein
MAERENPDVFRAVRRQISTGMDQEILDIIGGELVAPGLTVKTYVDTCIDFGEFEKHDGQIVFKESPTHT